MSLNISEVQQWLQREGVDGWLLYDFRGLNPVAQSLSPFDGLVSRRWFMLIPAEGEPTLLLHAIEESSLAEPVAQVRTYTNRGQLETELEQMIGKAQKLAMEYSPRNDNPYISRVDAGTLELVRSLGPAIVSSANLVQHFHALWDTAGMASHKVAANVLIKIMGDMFDFVREGLRAGRDMDEYGVQQEILRRFREFGMEWDHPPIVAVGPHTALPHYIPTARSSSPITRGNVLLIDAFCRQQSDAASISGDITWTAFVGHSVPDSVRQVFSTVAAARDAGVSFIEKQLSLGKTIHGWQVDEQVRSVIEKAGYGEYFTHRTGHSLGHEVHSNGVNLDNFETKDNRILEPGVGFTIEPGIYLPGEFGIRSEINCFVDTGGSLVVSTLPLQTEIQPLL